MIEHCAVILSISEDNYKVGIFEVSGRLSPMISVCVTVFVIYKNYFPSRAIRKLDKNC